MPAIGTIYSYPQNPRVWKAQIAAAYLGLELDVSKDFQMGVTNKETAFLSKFPFGKVPAMETADGPLYESDAIALYVANYVKNSPLLGASNYERAQIEQYVAFAANELSRNLTTWIWPMLGFAPYNKEIEKTAKANMQRALSSLNMELATKTFLVGERVTLADITVACTLSMGFSRLLDATFRASIPHVVRWFTTCVNQPNFAKVMGTVTMCETAEVYDASKFKPAAEPKKEKAKKEKAAKKPEPEEEEEEDYAKEEKPKAKNPLDLLPPSPFILDAWKRFYSNNDPRPASVDYFWTNYDPKGFSMWKVDYKYNDELEAIFKSSNLIGGFFQRLDHARKYAFGSMIVTGDASKSAISGYFVFRGDDIPFEVRDAADFDSYQFTKVNSDDAAVKEAFNDYLAWEGKSLPGPFADGKIFK